VFLCFAKHETTYQPAKQQARKASKRHKSAIGKMEQKVNLKAIILRLLSFHVAIA